MKRTGLFYFFPGLLLAGIACHSHPCGSVPHPLPQALIIGDSISWGYYEPLVKILEGKAVVVHNPGNAQHSKFGLIHLDEWLGDTPWTVIHFNHGLHDLKQVNGKIQIPLDDYRKFMEEIVQRLEKTGATLIFATTTPVPAGSLDGPVRDPADVARYNAAALEIMKRHEIRVNDLYSFTLPRIGELQRPRNVHFTPAGSDALAREVARHILDTLDQK